MSGKPLQSPDLRRRTAGGPTPPALHHDSGASLHHDAAAPVLTTASPLHANTTAASPVDTTTAPIHTTTTTRRSPVHTTTAPIHSTTTTGPSTTSRAAAKMHAIPYGRIAKIGLIGLCSMLLLVPLLFILPMLASHYFFAPADKAFAFSTTHNVSINPAAIHSRYRRAEYSADKNFFQWWNFLIYDAKTHSHFTLLYGIVDFPKEVSNKYTDKAAVGFYQLQGSKRIASGGDKIPLSQLNVTNHFDLAYLDSQGKQMHSMKGEDDGTYTLSARGLHPMKQIQRTSTTKTTIQVSDSSVTNDTEGGMKAGSINTEHEENISSQVDESTEINWLLNVKRIHGAFTAQDQEHGNKETCMVQSTLFAYNSLVSGYIQVGSERYDFDDSDRYRVYAAGSWGCQLPSGTPEVEYPWSWGWLVLPGADWTEKVSGVGNRDVSLVTGYARFQLPGINVQGGYSVLSYGPASNPQQLSSRFASLAPSIMPNTNLPVMASASDGYFSNFTIERDNWANYSDPYGTAKLPLRQKFISETSGHIVTADFVAKLDQFFRIPVTSYQQGSLKIFSDFRAVGANVQLTVVNKHTGDVLLDKHSKVLNAVEYAYAAEVNDAMLAALDV